MTTSRPTPTRTDSTTTPADLQQLPAKPLTTKRSSISSLYTTLTSPIHQALEKDHCPICLTSTLPGRFSRLTLPCKHHYCASCMTLGLSTSTDTDASAIPTCPLCRGYYRLNLYTLHHNSGLTLALPFDALATFAILMSVTLSLWILGFLRMEGFADLGAGGLPWCFWLLYATLLSWLGMSAHASGYCLCATGQIAAIRSGMTKSVSELANSTVGALYLWGAEVAITLWMVSAMVLMVSGLVARFGIEMFLILYERQ